MIRFSESEQGGLADIEQLVCDLGLTLESPLESLLEKLELP